MDDAEAERIRTSIPLLVNVATMTRDAGYSLFPEEIDQAAADLTTLLDKIEVLRARIAELEGK